MYVKDIYIHQFQRYRIQTYCNLLFLRKNKERFGGKGGGVLTDLLDVLSKCKVSN